MEKRFRKPTTKEILSVMDDNAPFSYVESYKSLCTNFEFIAAAQDCKNILITSTIANEGKTNISSNLALTLSGYGKKVCLVECDLRRPSAHRLILMSRNTEGLTNVLKGEIELSKAIKHVDNSNMDILLAGKMPPNPSELLASEKMKNIIDELAAQYDYIIYDTPPVLLVTDAATLGKYMDGALLVVSHNKVERSVVLKAKKNLDSAGVKILGAIYSMYSMKTAETYSRYSSYNYYYYYGYGYGQSPKDRERDKEKNAKSGDKN